VLDQITDQSGVLVDVGCGNGRYVRRIREQRYELMVVGLDIAAGILSDLDQPVLVADALRLPFSDQSVNVALAMHMIYHLPDIDAGLRELARVLRPGGVLIASTNARDDKSELDRLWSAAAADVLGVPEGARRISLSDRFPLDDAPALLRRCFADVRVVNLPGTITVTDPDPVIAHLASYRSWADQAGVPFDPTVERARRRLTEIIDRHGAFQISCRGGVLVCHGPR